MVNALVLFIGAVAGFGGSRLLRRPAGAARAASAARHVGGSLGRRKGLSAPELQRACFSEMVRHVRVDRQGRTQAPARYELHLHPDDMATVEEARRWFIGGLGDALRQAAAANGWTLDGTVAVEYVADPVRRPGVPSALALASDRPQAGDSAAPPKASVGTEPAPAEDRTLAVVRSDTAERIALVADVVTIGRSRDRTVMIDDSRVSRSHARIEPRRSAWVLVDEGSANGTKVRGGTLPPGQPCALRAGDVIDIGPVELRVTTATGLDPSPDPQAGTRALDDRDRNRISAEVLPPKGGNERR